MDLFDLFLKAAQDVQSPNVRIEPYEKLIDCAVQAIKMLEPSYFVGVETIKVSPSAQYGHVSSDNPAIININAGRISQEIKSGTNALVAIIGTIAHERGHVKDFNQETGQFMGGEGAAENEERRMIALVEQNMNKLEALPCFKSK